MKKILLVLIYFISIYNVRGQSSNWQIVAGKITTPWAQQVNPNAVLPEYPRPQMVRENWLNLNGLWDYAIQQGDSKPNTYQGKILVPYPLESALSGVGKRVDKDQSIWYRRTVSIPGAMKNKNILLHFGAVDWRCTLYINGKEAGSHQGGFDPFYFDITRFLNKSNEQEIVLRVSDPTDEGPQPRGKQVKTPNSIWYTPVTGIWQTVWFEAVPLSYIHRTKHIADIEKNELKITTSIKNFKAGDRVKISVWEGNRRLNEKEFSDTTNVLSIADAKRWSPSNPFLYDMRVALTRKGKVIDEIKTYFAMRKISMAPDDKGVQRMLLNNEFVFQYGPLDQGWWPDGLYTAPTDEALKFDIEKTKAMGFNMIRKHVKVEPARWYYHCDRIGLLVWQDMPSGDMGNHWEPRPGVVGLGTERNRSPNSENIFKREWKAIIDATFNFPCIVVWVSFNEAWGQFKTEEVVQWTMTYDPSRLVNAASGGNFVPVGHIIDLHNYPAPAMPDPKLYGADQIIVLGEYGGLGLPLEGHTWQTKDNWGYQSFSTPQELKQKYEAFIVSLSELIPKGLSAAVYTQTTDVEIETNGLMTYDRKVIKIEERVLHLLHQPLYNHSIKFKP